MNRPIPTTDTFASARLCFPAMERWTYLDVAGRCPLSRTTSGALNAHLDENVSDGLNMIATAFQRRRGDNVILCPELEHPTTTWTTSSACWS